MPLFLARSLDTNKKEREMRNNAVNGPRPIFRSELDKETADRLGATGLPTGRMSGCSFRAFGLGIGERPAGVDEPACGALATGPVSVPPSCADI